jgi:hypothetical protein
VTSLLWILLRLLDQDEQKKPGRYERVSTLQRSSAWICWSSFSAQHKAPEVSSVLLECTLGKLRTDKGAKKFLNVEMEQKTLRKGVRGNGQLKKLQSSFPTDLHLAARQKPYRA